MASSNPNFTDYQQFTPPPYEEPPRQRGCFFYGCIIASILSLLLAIAVGLIFFFIYRWFSGVVDEYTATAPRELPRVEMPAERRRTVAERFDAFKKAVEEGTPTEPLVLNSDDLNALIEDRTDFKGKIYATIEKDKLKGEVSIPLDEIPSFGLTRGRYLNGQAELKVSLEGGLLLVTIDSFEINGKQLPSQFMEGVRQQNLAKELYKDVKNVEKIRKLESIVIKDGQIIIKAKDRQKDKHGVKPADAPPEETKPGKADAHPPDQPAKKTEPASNSAPTAKKSQEKELPPIQSPPSVPAEPAKKP